jgi:pentatricopeptide repeat protein
VHRVRLPSRANIPMRSALPTGMQRLSSSSSSSCSSSISANGGAEMEVGKHRWKRDSSGGIWSFTIGENGQSEKPKKVKRNNLNRCLNFLAELGDMVGAMELLELARAVGWNPKTVSYNSAIKACARCAHADNALLLLRAMELSGVVRNIITFNSVILACIRCGRMATALHILEQMEQHGVPPDVVTYSSLMWGEDVSHASGKMALAVIEAMQQSRVRPNEITFTAAFAACSRSGDYEAASTLLRKMVILKVPHTRASIGAAIAVFSTTGWDKQADELYEEAWSKGILRPSRHLSLLSLDFHMHSVQCACTAMRVVIRRLRTRYSNWDAKGAQVTVEIITGHGLHRGQEARVQPAIRKYLQDHFGIESVVDPHNAGRLLVKLKDIMRPGPGRSKV